jgi:hypothetical protein
MGHWQKAQVITAPRRLVRYVRGHERVTAEALMLVTGLRLGERLHLKDIIVAGDERVQDGRQEDRQSQAGYQSADNHDGERPL